MLLGTTANAVRDNHKVLGFCTSDFINALGNMWDYIKNSTFQAPSRSRQTYPSRSSGTSFGTLRLSLVVEIFEELRFPCPFLGQAYSRLQPEYQFLSPKYGPSIGSLLRTRGDVRYEEEGRAPQPGRSECAGHLSQETYCEWDKPRKILKDHRIIK